MNILLSIISYVKRCGLALCCVFLVSLPAAASQDDIGAFLLGARDDNRVLTNQDNWLGIGEVKSSLIPLEDVEFRAGLGEAGVSEGDYVMRLSFGSFSENRAESESWKANEAMFESRYNVALSEALRKRYRQLLSVQGLSNELALSERRIDLLEDQLSAYRSFVDSPEFSFVKLMNVEQDLDKARLKQMRLKRARNKAAVVLREYGAASESNMSDSWLKSVDDVIQIIGNSLPLDVSASDAPLLSSNANAVLAAEKQLDLQRTKDNVFLSFIDVKYDALDDAYSTQLAVKIPFGAKTDRAVVEAKTRLKAVRREQQLLQQALPQKLLQTQQALQELHEAYRLVEKRLQDDSRSESALSVSNPLMMFRVSENILQWELEEAVIRQQILEHYVDMLHLNGQLAAQPLKNYLSKHEEQL